MRSHKIHPTVINMQHKSLQNKKFFTHLREKVLQIYNFFCCCCLFSLLMTLSFRLHLLIYHQLFCKCHIVDVTTSQKKKLVTWTDPQQWATPAVGGGGCLDWSLQRQHCQLIGQCGMNPKPELDLSGTDTEVHSSSGVFTLLSLIHISFYPFYLSSTAVLRCGSQSQSRPADLPRRWFFTFVQSIRLSSTNKQQRSLLSWLVCFLFKYWCDLGPNTLCGHKNSLKNEFVISWNKTNHRLSSHLSADPDDNEF